MSCHFCRTQSLWFSPALKAWLSMQFNETSLSPQQLLPLGGLEQLFCLLSHSPSKLGICLQRETNHMFEASSVPFVFYSGTRFLFWFFVSQKHPSVKGQIWMVMCQLHLKQIDDSGDKQLQIFMVERTLSLGFHLLSILFSYHSPQQVYILIQHHKAVEDFNVSSRSFWPISSVPLHLLP